MPGTRFLKPGRYDTFDISRCVADGFEIYRYRELKTVPLNEIKLKKYIYSKRSLGCFVIKLYFIFPTKITTRFLNGSSCSLEFLNLYLSGIKVRILLSH